MSGTATEGMDDLARAKAEALARKNGQKKESASTEEKELVTSPESMIAGFIDFTGLADLFKNTVAGYSLNDPFVGGEIVVYVTTCQANVEDRGFIGKTKEIMAVNGNKPFNAFLALWLHNLGRDETKKELFDKYIKYFKFIKEENYNQKQYIFNCKAMLFAHMLLMTRGSIPSITENSKNPLPKLMVTNLGYEPGASEADFANAFAGFDIRKVKFVEFLNVPFSIFPDAIKNRMLKGTAGSRVLKLFTIASTYGDGSSPDAGNVEIFKAFCIIAGQGKCYLSLHPLIQKVQSAINEFYSACVGLIAENLGEGLWAVFLKECLLIPTFKNDKALNNVSFNSGKPRVNGNDYSKAFKTVTPERLKDLFGSPLKVE